MSKWPTNNLKSLLPATLLLLSAWPVLAVPQLAAPPLAAPTLSAESAKAPACKLLAHLNESQESVTKEGLSLPRWYDLHHRLLRLLTDEAGCQLEVIGSPWSRSLTLLQQGKIDLMLTMSYTDERNQFTDFLGVHYQEESVLVLHKDYVERVQQLSDIRLLPGTIGVLKDAYYGAEFSRYQAEPTYQSHLQYANSLTQKLNMLKRKRVLGMIEDKTQFLEWSRTYPELAETYRLSLTLHRAPVYIVASRAALTDARRERLRQAWQRVYGKAAHLAILAEFGWTLP